MDLLPAVFSVISVCLSGGIFIVQLMTRNEITQAKLDIMSMMREQFASTDRVDGIEQRLNHLESRAHAAHQH